MRLWAVTSHTNQSRLMYWRCMSWPQRRIASVLGVLRELTTHLNHWCIASSGENFEGLWNLVILEQFKDTLPSRVATYINELLLRLQGWLMSMCSFIMAGLVSLEGSLLGERRVVDHLLVLPFPKVRGSGQHCGRERMCVTIAVRQAIGSQTAQCLKLRSSML